MKKLIPLLLICGCCLQLKAQSLNNIYEDTKILRGILDSSATFTATDSAKWDKIINKYIAAKYQTDGDAILKYLKTNPFLTVKLIAPLPGQSDSSKLRGLFLLSSTERLNHVLATPISEVSPTASGGTFSTSSVTDALVNLIIERAKEELTATFFQNLKNELDHNDELLAAFPKTTKYLGQIQPYMYASFLSTLRQSFFSDINDIPYNIGSILRTTRMKQFMAKYPAIADVWLTVPVLQFLGDMHKGKSIADAIKDLYPDPELYPINAGYYNILKFTAVLSESIRDKTGQNDWINPEVLATFLSDPKNSSIFFGLLYESTKYGLIHKDGTVSIVNNYITAANIATVKAILTSFAAGYNKGNGLFKAYQDIKSSAEAGKPITLTQALTLIDSSTRNLKATLDNVALLAPSTEPFVGKTDAYFNDISQLVIILENFDQKNYSSGIMNSLLLINQYIAPQVEKLKPFKNQIYQKTLAADYSNINIVLQLTLNDLTAFSVRFPDDKKITGLIKDLNNIASSVSLPLTSQEVETINKLFSNIQSYQHKSSDDFDEGGIYQKLLRYGSLMAALAEAKTTAQVTAALDNAILPVGSSSIKFYTAFSISINSYIGGAYYNNNYNLLGTSGKINFNSLGVALPIGLNLSVSTRWKEVGAISGFISVVDLGAVASYRLNNPPTTTNNQTLPAFTFQNLLAPGAFIVFNRLFNTPLAIGIGGQRAPQLSKITDGSADLTTDPKWRFGAFLSVDIPLFNLYSSALKRPLKQ